jgi:DNA polymerase, archaea type
MEKNLEFMPIDYDYFDFEGRNYVRMIGRNEKGQRVCVVDSYDANFYLILREGHNADTVMKKVGELEVEKGGRVSKVLKMEVLEKNFLGEKKKAIRVWITNHKDAHEMTSMIGDMEEIDFRREWDIPLVTKYIKEKKVEPSVWYKIETEKSEVEKMVEGLDVEDCFFAKSIKPLGEEKKFIPKVLAYDIETTGREIGEGEILMISVFGEGVKKVISWKNIEEVEDYVEIVEDEAEMLERFCEIVRDADADVLTGYFSDGFDLPYLKARADFHKVTLNLGVDGRSPTFARGRIPSGKITGLVHVDLYRFIDAVFSQYLQSETLSLNEVASELVGSKKEDFDFSKLGNMKDEDWKSFFSYNLQDSVVTHELALKIWPDITEFCKIIKEPIFDVTRDRMATHVENHILHNLDRFDEIAERRPGYHETNERKMNRKFEGANVFEPTPGFYENLVMFDFTSMHASLIVSFNISGQNLRFQNNGDCHVAPEFELDRKTIQVYFDKKPGFFSTLLAEVVEKRKKFKKEYMADKNAMKKARSNAYKLLANATFGYQGFFGARYYSREAAAATLAFVRKFNEDTMKKIKEEGYEIIYGDTDSIAFLTNKKKKWEILNFLKRINEDLPGIMELDLEDFFTRGLFVAKRGVKTGAKKKYALLSESGKIKIRGFETVRRDWCRLSRNLQDQVLRKILKDGNEKGSLELVKDVVGKLKSRNVELEDLMIKTKLKRPLDEYVSEGPHVVAAKKMIEAGASVSVGTFVEYFVGEGSGKKVGDRVYLVGERVKYDMEYYLKKQILPAVEGIFDVFGVDVGAIIEGERQEKLF